MGVGTFDESMVGKREGGYIRNLRDGRHYYVTTSNPSCSMMPSMHDPREMLLSMLELVGPRRFRFRLHWD